ncbi:glucose-1-phosphate adenylyltransferase large subunit 1, chloroplastic isoform X3 [Amborella trichopoda]|uniref:glucose-1-phosphate adenylyltransferase large subunit 1, chloroplastic isoform X3 n=1 Tax=Amborella trichopoda TaxID=13333 RepID=UPI0009C0D3ED|nr:glucose-1-phosphate adenylyltransferase large subunit 1, chloroplastic isoform X3 [Amborella trichopoda]|eukprot:XP_020527009.1 glucose-1-phosphate adenylyltransferase large subunit 1, chloroplastic isoform X3 [Amborella trichopoda]
MALIYNHVAFLRGDGFCKNAGSEKKLEGLKFGVGEVMGKQLQHLHKGMGLKRTRLDALRMSLTTHTISETKFRDIEMEKRNPRSVVAVILGGGAGTRLFPLTKRRAKPAVPIGGAYRLIDVPMSSCINSGINKIYILTQFNSASLNRHLSRAYNFGNGVNFGDGFVEALAATQTPGEAGMKWFQGTADAVRQFHWLFEDAKGKEIEDVLILSGDHLYRMDYMDFVQDHRKSGADITISCLPMDDRWRFPTANDFGSEIIPASAREFFIKAFLFNDYWEDIGTIKSFFEANLALTAHPPNFSFYDATKPMYTSPRNLPPTKVDNSKIVDSIVSHGSFLDNCLIEHTVVGIRSRINHNAHVKDTVMLGADYYETDAEVASLLAEGRVPVGIGENTKIRNCIIDKNARIGKNIIISNSEGVQEADRSSEGFYIRSGITIILKNSTIKDGFVI